MLEKFVIPENTKFEEKNIVVEGDAIIGANSNLSYGVIAKKIVVGDKTSIDGDLIGEEVRVGEWCNVRGNITSNNDAYIGEFTTIGGKLTVYGDLEIGRNVRIKDGFEAKGLITIQDPLPIIMFIFLYILELLRLGRLEDIEKLFEEEKFETPFIAPENSIVTIEKIETRKDMEIVGSRVLGNLRAKNVLIESSEIFGSVRGKDIVLDGCKVHGAVEGRTVYIVNGSEVVGYIKAEKVYMEEKCCVEGSIIGRQGVWIKPTVELPTEGLEMQVEKTKDEKAEEGILEKVEDGESLESVEIKEKESIEEKDKGEVKVKEIEDKNTKNTKINDQVVEDVGVEEREVQKDVS
ncbi:acyltransferase [Archaeoglobales archaeon]|nr:MAG: acyltransferase [Archaeoglobales archaeon]